MKHNLIPNCSTPVNLVMEGEKQKLSVLNTMPDFNFKVAKSVHLIKVKERGNTDLGNTMQGWTTVIKI